MRRLRPVEIEKAETAGLSSKALDCAIKNSAGAPLQSEDTPRNTSVFAPDFNGQAARLNLQPVLVWEEWY